MYLKKLTFGRKNLMVHRLGVRNIIILQLIFNILCVFYLTGCCKQGVCKLEKAASKLDKLDKKLEEWGTVTISEPIVLENKGQFNIDLILKTEDNIARARTQVDASVLATRQTALDVQTAVGI
jgi:hypothetical protein